MFKLSLQDSIEMFSHNCMLNCLILLYVFVYLFQIMPNLYFLVYLVVKFC